MKRFEIINGKCVIPEGTDYIEDYEFYCSDDLREVVFPESLSSIGREAFKGCWNLREIHLPAGLVEIEEGAFSGCCSLEVIEVAKGNPIFGSEGNCCLTDDGKTLVFGCKASVIPDTVETVGRAACQWCETVTGISIPASVRNIENRAFYGCLALRDLKFSSAGNLLRIGADSFSRCACLRAVTIPESVRKIGAGAFAECPYLWSVNIPGGVICIEDGTFFGCQTLSRLSIPDSVAETRRDAACGCRNLEGLKIPASVHTIGSYAFSECGRREETKIPVTVRMLGHDVASVYVPEEIDDEDHLEEVKREEECDVEPSGGGDSDSGQAGASQK